jgi:5-methylcytosine-specific restriction endonuclease McrA
VSKRREDPNVVAKERAAYKIWYAQNREQKAAYKQQWDAANPEKARANERRRRARKAAATIEPFTPADLRHDWEDHDLWDCFFCGGPLTDLHVDHFYPLKPADEDATPGPHAIFNLVPSCAECNLSKSNGDPWAFLRDALEARGIDLDACLKLFDVD